MKPKIKLLILGLGALLITVKADADIDGALDSMYNSLQVSPSMTQNSRQHVLSGGVFRLRSPQRKFNIVSLNPPRMSAGCGGIDLYGGSFTFINSEQFRALLRQIGSQALGYAFQVALNELCSVCTDVMSKLQNKIQQLNEMFTDTCRWAKWGVESTLGSKIEGAKKDRKDYNALESGLDTFGSWLDDWEFPGAATDLNQTCADDEKKNGVCPQNNKVGNFLAKKLFSADVPGNIVGMTDDQLNKIAINIIGMTVVGSESKEEAPKVEDFKNLITYEDMLYGGQNPQADSETKQIYVCDKKDPEIDQARTCAKPIREDWNWGGSYDYVMTKFLGERSNGERTGVDNGKPSIVQRLATGSHAALESDQLQFLYAIPSTMMDALIQAQGDEKRLTMVAHAIGLKFASKVQYILSRSVIDNIHKKLGKDGAFAELYPIQQENLKRFEEDAEKHARSFKLDIVELEALMNLARKK